MKTEFKEEQRFTQWWLWLILIGIGISPIFGIIKQLIHGVKFSENLMYNLGLISLSIFLVVLIALFRSIRLKTDIDTKEIRLNFFPFAKKQLKWSEIKSAQTLDYGFVGGWGVRLFTKYGTVYNTNGSKGLTIELKNGKKFLIGTQKETELNEIIENIVYDLKNKPN